MSDRRITRRGSASSQLHQHLSKALALEQADIEASSWVTPHHRGVLTDRAEFLAHLARFTAEIEERAQRLLGQETRADFTTCSHSLLPRQRGRA